MKVAQSVMFRTMTMTKMNQTSVCLFDNLKNQNLALTGLFQSL